MIEKTADGAVPGLMIEQCRLPGIGDAYLISMVAERGPVAFVEAYMLREREQKPMLTAAGFRAGNQYEPCTAEEAERLGIRDLARHRMLADLEREQLEWIEERSISVWPAAPAWAPTDASLEGLWRSDRFRDPLERIRRLTASTSLREELRRVAGASVFKPFTPSED